MGLETATYISQLNAAWPIGAADPKSQGDDHLRLLKSTIQASFPNITGAMTLTHTQLNNAAIKNESNTFTLQQILSSTQPRLTWNETDAAANNRRWDLQAQGEQFKLLALSDDELSSSAPLTIDRTGTATDSIAFAAALLTSSAPGLFTASSTGPNGDGGLGIASALPAFSWRETDGAANNRTWLAYVNGEQFRLGVINDANTLITDYMAVDRTGQTVDSISLTATTVMSGGRVRVNSSGGEIMAIAAADAVGDGYIQWYESLAFSTTKAYVGYGGGANDVFDIWNTENAAVRIGTNNAERFVVDAGGQISGTSIHNNAGGAAGTTPYIASGTYTPTYTNGTNVDATSHVAAQWMRVGNVVTVSGVVAVDATIINNPTVIGISLPIASNLTSVGECAGVLSQGTNNANGHGQIVGDTANDRASGSFTCNIGTSANVAYQFTYVVK